LEQLQKEQKQLELQIREVDDRMQTETQQRPPSSQREECLKRMQQLESLRHEKYQELQMYKDNDPVMMKAKEKATAVAKRAANRWTDNILTLQSYCSQQFFVASDVFCQQFGIPENFDLMP